jgi:hypothetical protein
MGLDKKARAEKRALKMSKKREDRRTNKFVFNRMLDAEMFDEIPTKQKIRHSSSG